MSSRGSEEQQLILLLLANYYVISLHSVIINQEERFPCLFLFLLVIAMCEDLTESSAIKLNDPCRRAVWLWGGGERVRRSPCGQNKIYPG